MRRAPLGVGRDRSRRARSQRAARSATSSRLPHVWAVVKADGYGHGARAVAAQALRSGAAGLCVALAQEGVRAPRGRDRGADPRAQRAAAGPDRRHARRRPHADRVHRRRTSTRSPPPRRPARRRAATCTSRSTPACNASAPIRRDAVALARPRVVVARAAAGRRVTPISPAPTSPASPANDEQLAAFDAGARRARSAGAATARTCTPPTRRRRSPIPRVASTWCGPGSRSTASRPGPASTTSPPTCDR